MPLPGVPTSGTPKDLLLPLESSKLAPQFIGPFEVDGIVNPSALCCIDLLCVDNMEHC